MDWWIGDVHNAIFRMFANNFSYFYRYSPTCRSFSFIYWLDALSSWDNLSDKFLFMLFNLSIYAVFCLFYYCVFCYSFCWSRSFYWVSASCCSNLALMNSSCPLASFRQVFSFFNSLFLLRYLSKINCTSFFNPKTTVSCSFWFCSRFSKYFCSLSSIVFL